MRLVLLFAAVIPALCGGDWNPKLAAGYLESRQKDWFAWPYANRTGTPCISCHTGMPYLLSRPALARALGGPASTAYEAGLLDGMRQRLSKRTAAEFAPAAKEPHASELIGVEAVLSALFLARDESGRRAFERLWSLQIASGENRGAWYWSSLKLDPWEEADSVYYGAALAALAVARAPADYQSKTEIRDNVSALKDFLARRRAAQPLHNRLLLLWASAELRDTIPAEARQAIIGEALAAQSADGGWTIASLGPWAVHAAAAPAEGSNAYATGLTAYILQRAGVARNTPALAKALEWLRSHQDPAGGFWAAASMNKQYEAGSMPASFMRDSATGFAALALLGE